MIVTKITEPLHRESGLRIGSIISEINDQWVEQRSPQHILSILDLAQLPLQILFKEQLFDINITSKLPLGFLLDRELTGFGAMVTKVYDPTLQRLGLKMGCCVYRVGASVYCDDLEYKKILSVIAQQHVPFTITFRTFDIDLHSDPSSPNAGKSVKDDDSIESALQHLVGGTVKNYFSIDTVLDSWRMITAKMSKETMINQSIASGYKMAITQSPCIERIEFIMAYYQRWIADHKGGHQKVHDL